MNTTPIQLVEIIDPPAGAIVRSFHCAVCDKTHLQQGPIARVWVSYQEGYLSNASPDCIQITQQIQNFVQFIRNGWATELAFDCCYDAVYDLIDAESFLNLCQAEVKSKIENA